MMRLLKTILNIEAKEPTVGFRGLLAIIASIALVSVMEWNWYDISHYLLAACAPILFFMGVAMVANGWDSSRTE